MTTLSLIALLLFAGYNTATIIRFGTQDCFSRFYYRWLEAVPAKSGINVFSVVCIALTFLLVPPMLSACNGALQATGFFCPVFFGIVGVCPAYKASRGKHALHTTAAILSAVGSVVWLISTGRWLVLIPVMVAILATAIASNSLMRAWTYWLEMLAIYSVLFALVIYG